jgi:type I restriction enzyme S subunit
MSSQINKRLLGDFCSFKYGKTIRKCEVDNEGDFPVFSGYQVVGYLESFMYDEPQLLIVCRGIGGTGDIKFSPAKCSITNLSIVIEIKDSICQHYLFWVLKTADTYSLRTGSAQPQITINDLERFPVLIHESEQEQKAIAHILGTLDDKIELNRKTNETLEAMAKALFKSWFVDFDPVRAKAEGRSTGLPIEISDLLPDSFEDSELGEIPSGWEVKALDEIAHFLNGLALQKFPPEDGAATLPVIKIAQLKKGDSTGADRCSTAVPSDYVVRDGDVLFSWSGSLAVDIWCGGDGALNQHLFKVTSKTYGKWFFYQWVKHHLPVFQGSTFEVLW